MSNGSLTELRAEGLLIEQYVTVTTQFCKELDGQKIYTEAKKCQEFLGNLFKLFESQANEKTLKIMQSVAKLDGVPAPLSVEELAKNIKAQSMNMKILESKSVIANIGHFAQKCADLKRYTVDAEEVSASSSTHSPADTSTK